MRNTNFWGMGIARRWAPVGLGMLLCLPVWGSDVGGAASLRGEVVSRGPLSGSELELWNNQSSFSPIRRADLRLSGSFEFSDLESGWYNLRVLNAQGQVVSDRQVYVGGPDTMVTIELQGQDSQQSKSGSVSVGQLAQKIPRAASAELQKAQKAMRDKDIEMAALHSRKALSIYPQYVEAHNELGACAILQKQLPEAADEFRAAVALDSYRAGSWSNLGVALLALKQYDDAADAAQHAVQLDASLLSARYVLGMSLHAKKSDEKTALMYLEQSAEQFPNAHLAAAEILAANGSRVDAVAQVQQYLAHPDATADRQAVEAWLQRLEAQPR